jgi:hypothetical protein
MTQPPSWDFWDFHHDWTAAMPFFGFGMAREWDLER